MYHQFLNKDPILLPGNKSPWLLATTTSRQLVLYSVSYLLLNEKLSVFTSKYPFQPNEVEDLKASFYFALTPCVILAGSYGYLEKKSLKILRRFFF